LKNCRLLIIFLFSLSKFFGELIPLGLHPDGCKGVDSFLDKKTWLVQSTSLPCPGRRYLFEGLADLPPAKPAREGYENDSVLHCDAVVPVLVGSPRGG
jgi:hypothetical protein